MFLPSILLISGELGDARRGHQRRGVGMKIEVMVMGCAKCKRLERNIQQALLELGREEEIVRIEDIEEIKKRGTMRVPILYINGEMKAVGTVPSVEDIKAMLTSASG